MKPQPMLETCVSNSSSNMDNEDILEGWLSVPHMGTLLNGLPSPWPSPPGSVHFQSHDTALGVEASNSNAFGASGESPQSAVSPRASVDIPLTSAKSGDAPAEPPGLRKRRGHTKSRLGCITCKRRKIKVGHIRRGMTASCANLDTVPRTVCPPATDLC
jgi:hypothetical protein